MLDRRGRLDHYGVATMTSEKIFWSILVSIFIVARMALSRSHWWQSKGLCAQCGEAPGTTSMLGDRFCERCAHPDHRGIVTRSDIASFLGLALICTATAYVYSSLEPPMSGRFVVVIGALVCAGFWVRQRSLRGRA